jgi:cytochrome c oxidase cbb3-type subunit 2
LRPSWIIPIWPAGWALCGRPECPYSLTQQEYDANVSRFGKTVADQLDISQAQDSLMKQAHEKDFDGIPGQITEMEALVAYLQVLGTMVDFTKYDEGYFTTFR